MDSLPFPIGGVLGKRGLPSLLGAGIGAVAGAIAAGRRARDSIRADSSVKFPTWSERAMKPPARKISRRRYPRRRYVRVIRPRFEYSRRIVRRSNVFSTSLAAANFIGTLGNVALQDVYTTDLIAAYRLYRIRKVVVYVIPRVDAANSGVANNFTALISAACDPEGASTTPTENRAVTAYDNSHCKWVPSGGVFKYTYYPKAVNVVDNGGTATAVGSYAMNPWLQLNATGIAIPHRQLVMGYTTGNVTTVTFDRYFEIHFDVKGLA